SLTSFAKVFLDLGGRDALRWLLAVERAQSLGPEDDYRLSAETAGALIEKTKFVFEWQTNDLPPLAKHSWATMRRLAEFGLLKIEDDRDGDTWVEATVLGREVLGEAASLNQTPMLTLARSIAEDLMSAATRSLTPAVANMDIA